MGKEEKEAEKKMMVQAYGENEEFLRTETHGRKISARIQQYLNYH
jgi:hypothetical protein